MNIHIPIAVLLISTLFVSCGDNEEPPFAFAASATSTDPPATHPPPTTTSITEPSEVGTPLDPLQPLADALEQSRIEGEVTEARYEGYRLTGNANVIDLAQAFWGTDRVVWTNASPVVDDYQFGEFCLLLTPADIYSRPVPATEWGAERWAELFAGRDKPLLISLSHIVFYEADDVVLSDTFIHDGHEELNSCIANF